ncbi:MAG: hypothetical protein ACREDK_04925 [Thermoplasmata archaeon]
MGWPPSPGPGPYTITLVDPAFILLVTVLGVFVAMLWVLAYGYPRRKRGLEGYLEAAGVDLTFLVAGTLLVIGLALHDPNGNRTSLALYRVVLSGYWLAFSIPIVTVGSSVHSRTRGGIPWLYPSIVVAALLFVVFFAYFYGVP